MKNIIHGFCVFALFMLAGCQPSIEPENSEDTTNTSTNSQSVEETSNSEQAENRITITAGNTTIEAQLNESEAAKEFASRLPLTISMNRMGDHEYYGSLDQPLTHAEDTQVGYKVGDFAFWTPGDLFALYFDEPESPPEGLMILGEVTSDLEEVRALGNNEEMTIEKE